MPKLGIEYGICQGKREKPDLEGFNKAFEETLKLTEKALVDRYNYIASQSPEAAPFMYKNGTAIDADKCKEDVRETIRCFSQAVGYIGIAEMCQALFGVNHARSKEAYDFALGVVKRIYEFCKEASERNNLNFVCYATP